MLKITLIFVLLWLPSFVIGIDIDNFFVWRHQLIMLTGFLGLGYMCIAAVLAARFSWVESKVKGLDKGYALHKKLGIGALIALFTHWLLSHSAMWLIQAEVIAMPNRKHPMVEGINWHAVAEQVGDISFKVFLIFSIISLVQVISYKKFRFTHKIAGILIFAGVFHSAFLLDWHLSSVVMNIAIVLISIIGVWCSWLSLTGNIGKKNKSEGQVVFVKPLSGSEAENIAVRFTVQLETTINYKEGQFAYLDFHDGESAHPFSILDYDPQTKVVAFAVKNLGDYTNKLVNNLKKDRKVTVEGGYGFFQMSAFEHQVWVGAGIGIVPFISRLYWLKRKAEKQQLKVEKVHLFYCVNAQKEAFFTDEIITLLNHLNFIELYILDAQKGQLLDSEQVMQKVKDKSFDVSFCGPQLFGEALQAGLQLPEEQFHRELFKMR